MDIVVATNNGHKLREIREILGDKFDNIYSLKDMGIVCDPDENAPDFQGNADIKAMEIAKHTDLPVLADDSGLSVEALNGAPGVNSARYSGVHGDDEGNIRLLLENLKGVENRNASFVTCLTLYFGKDRIVRASGETKGSIMDGKTGENGFGYDPVFYSFELEKSFGEATAEEKNAVSHRAKALKNLLQKI